MEERFQNILTLQERMSMHRRLLPRLKAEARVAVIFQRGRDPHPPHLRVQVLMKEHHKISDAVMLLRKEMLLCPDRALYIYSSEGELLRPSLSLGSVALRLPSEDGFLYLYYVDVPSFGLQFNPFQEWRGSLKRAAFPEI